MNGLPVGLSIYYAIANTTIDQLWSNPFDVGCKGNWQQVFGPKPFIVSLLPSRRTPPPPIVDFFPLEDRDSRRGSDVSVGQ